MNLYKLTADPVPAPLSAIFAEIAARPATKGWVDEAHKALIAAGVPPRMIYVDRGSLTIINDGERKARLGVYTSLPCVTVHAPSIDGASGPVGYLGRCIGRIAEKLIAPDRKERP